MSRSRILALLLAAVASSCSVSTGKKKDPAPGKPKAAPCECAKRMEEDGCECPHCASMGAAFDPGDCPCARRGYK